MFTDFLVATSVIIAMMDILRGESDNTVEIISQEGVQTLGVAVTHIMVGFIGQLTKETQKRLPDMRDELIVDLQLGMTDRFMRMGGE
ncbi:MAG: hypothetical protein EBR82_85700 [Caulobacteraceae bacterium]|nr:hypothetical protein [Caulobacteraceae bacterium]